ncbi:hypothetical protein J7355_16190 [Endozoicomonas sp. G2_2]|uniref:hypothetical protein n=1 Tax=Endozoicomonas sp. G2_2 TaxID=2821092 RepID=UPI001ADB0963|nr:hypothetical protein [Endozoicomonas sp. G2_2]MBO9471630.1 hypothetical protein [Endozoicomonas sp. G2_2]
MTRRDEVTAQLEMCVAERATAQTLATERQRIIDRLEKERAAAARRASRKHT